MNGKKRKRHKKKVKIGNVKRTIKRKKKRKKREQKKDHYQTKRG